MTGMKRRTERARYSNGNRGLKGRSLLHSGTRKLFALCLAAAALALLPRLPGTSAAPAPIGTAKPVPAYTTLPSPRASAAFTPTVVVYPFEVTGEMPAQASNSIAQVFYQQLASAGGLRVLPTPKSVPRNAYLTNARQDNADYYVSGYLTPLGDGAAMVLQVVTADTGIMIFSKTTQIFNTGDASAQASLAREVMLVHSGQLAEYDPQQQQQGSATPNPEETHGASVPIGGIFSAFKHDKNSTNAPKTVSAADKPSRVAIIGRVTGSGIDTATLTNATRGLGASMNRYFKAQMDQTNAVDVASAANAICGDNRNATIAGGTLSQGHAHGKLQSTFTLRIYACFGAVLYAGTPVTADSVQGAIDNAVAAYAQSNPTNS